MFFSALGLLAALGGLGYLITRLIHPRMITPNAFSIAYPLGSGLFTFLLFLLSWFGVSLTMTSVAVAYACSIIIVGLSMLRKQRKLGRDHESKSTLQAPSVVAWGDRFPYIIIFGISFFIGYIAIMRGYSTWDAIGIWGVKGMGIAQEGTVLAGSRWGSHGLSYPLNIPLQIAIFRLLGENLLIGSKLIFPMFYLSLLLGIYTILKLQSGWKVGFLGAILLGTTPILFEHATIGYANLPFTTYLVLGLMNLMQGVRERDTKCQFLGGLLLGLASWTRPEGAFLIIPILIVIYFGLRAFDLKGSSSLSHWALPPLVIIAVWQTFMLLSGAQGLLGDVLRSAWVSVRGGNLNLGAIYWTARFSAGQVIDPGVWGLILPVGLLFVIFRWREVFSRQNNALIFLVVPAVTAGLSIFAYYYLISFQQDIQYLLGTSVNRLFMPVWVLGFLGVWCVLSGEGRLVQEIRISDPIAE